MRVKFTIYRYQYRFCLILKKYGQFFFQDRYGTGLQNWTIVTITVTNADDNELTFLQSVYEVLVTANPLKVSGYLHDGRLDYILS